MNRLDVLGSTKLVCGDTVVTDFGGVKGRQLLEILAVHHGESVNKECLAELLWEGRPPTSYHATLESHVSVVRRRLLQAGMPRSTVRTVSNGYLLSDELPVDLTDLRRLLRLWRDQPAQALGTVGESVPDAESLLSSSPHASYTAREQAILARQIAEACLEASRHALRVGRAWEAVTLARRAQGADPMSEVALQALMAGLVALGARADALRSFADFRERLHEELGVEPGAATHRAYLEILTGSVDAATDESGALALEHRLLTRLLKQISPAGLVGTTPLRTPARTSA